MSCSDVGEPPLRSDRYERTTGIRFRRKTGPVRRQRSTHGMLMGSLLILRIVMETDAQGWVDGRHTAAKASREAGTCLVGAQQSSHEGIKAIF